jgi:signal transduction histidine kinase
LVAVGALAALLTRSNLPSLERRLFEAIEEFPEALILWDAEDRLILCNSHYRELAGPLADFAKTGVTFEELVRHAVALGLYDLGGAAVDAFVADRLAEHRSPAMPIETLQRAGKWLLIREHRTDDGGTISLYTDITQQKQVQIAAEQAADGLVEKQRQLDIALDNMIQGILFFGPDHRLILSNKRFREFFHYGPDQPAVGTPLIDVVNDTIRAGNYSQAEAEKMAEQRLQAAAHHERSMMLLRLADGRLLEILRQPLPNLSSVVTFTDITDRDRASRELVAAKDAAEAASRAKTEFLARVSHELRTPLNAIIGFSEIIRDRVFGPTAFDRYADYAADINFSGQHLLNVINDILDMAKIEAGQQKIADDVVDLHEQIDQACSMLRSTVRENKVDLVTDVTTSLPPIRADRRLMLQLILNLLSNGLKFTPAGGRVSIAALRDERGGIVVAVTDTGIGIPEQDRGQVFEPFYQVDKGNDRRFEGTGLGLSICRSIMQLHDGTIHIDSTVGVGTRITLYFPPTRVLAA